MALTVIAFWPVLSADFIHLDDTLYVTRNPHVLAGWTASGLGWAWTEFYAGFWAPVLWMSYMAEIALFGPNPAVFHADNLILHLFNVVLVFYVLHVGTQAFWRSAAAAALFAIHPLRVESVAWIVERKDVLSLFFGLIAIRFYIRHIQTPRPWTYAVVMTSFALGLMTKSILVTLPCILLLLDFWPLNRWSRHTAWRLIREKMPLFGLSFAFSALTFAAHRQFGGVQTVESLSFVDRGAHALVAYGWYLLKMVWPAGLAVFYPYPSPPFGLATAGAAAALLLALSVGVFLLRRNHPYLVTGWLWYLGALVPVIGLVQVGMQAWADRFTYLPMIGVVIAGVWLVSALSDRWRMPVTVRAALPCVVLIALLPVTRIQSMTWQNSETVARQALEATGRNFIAETLLGNYFEDRGDDERAIAQYRKAVEANPDYFVPYSRLGILLDRQGHTEEAVRYYARALERNADLMGIQLLLGRALQRQGKIDMALELYQNVLRNDPADPHANYAAGTAYEALGELDRALSCYTEAARLEPAYGAARTQLLEKMRQPE